MLMAAGPGIFIVTLILKLLSRWEYLYSKFANGLKKKIHFQLEPYEYLGRIQNKTAKISEVVTKY